MKTQHLPMLSFLCLGMSLAACSGSPNSLPGTGNSALAGSALGFVGARRAPKGVAAATVSYVAINAGGEAVGDWEADTGYSGGKISVHRHPVSTTLVSSPPNPIIYQYQRYAPNLIYTVAGLTPEMPYNARLHFAETYFTSAGQRVFGITINGTQVASGFDIFKASGGEYNAIAESFSGVADASGTITVDLKATVNNAMIAGMELTATPNATPAPSPSASQSQIAAAADAFVDSIGVNTHLSYSNTVYGWYLTTPAPNGATIVSALEALGVRHIRDGNMNTQLGAYRCPIYQQLFARGIDVDGVIQGTSATADIADMAKCLGPALFALEGPNELDYAMNFNSAFAQQDVNEMQILSNARGSAYPASVKIFGPTTVQASSDVALTAVSGDIISSYLDYANGHVYFGDNNPESAGWGGNQGFGPYGAISTDIAEMESVSPGKPYVTTETGYTDNSSSPTNVSPAAKATYLMRDLLQHWLLGAKYTYVYELADAGGNLAIMDQSLNPRPAYTAIQNLISILKDPGARISPSSLKASLTAPADVEHVLLQKRDGSYWLVLWQNEPIANTTTGAPIAIAASTVNISLATLPSALNLYSIDATSGSASVSVLSPSISLSANVTTTPEIIQIGASAPPALMLNRERRRIYNLIVPSDTETPRGH